MLTSTFFSKWWERASVTLLLALFSTSFSWAQYVIVFANPEEAGVVRSGKSADALTEGFVSDAAAGETIYFTFEANQGYHFDQITYDDNILAEDVTEADGIYSFVMPEAQLVQIKICFEQDPVVATGVEINAENFPDAQFRNWLLAQSYGSDAVITDEEMAGITSISAPAQGIADLTGIQYFTELRKLMVHNYEDTPEENRNQITAIDLSAASKLQTLWCDYNALVDGLDVSSCTDLSVLECNGCGLTSLNVAGNEKLSSLYCNDNQLAALDLTHNSKLAVLSCSGNQLTALDVSQNPLLEQLYCENNRLAAIDVTGHSQLRLFNCNDNQLTSLDVSDCPELYQLYCWNNQIKGEAMGTLMNSLPTRSGYCTVLDLRNGAPEQNEITDEQIAIGKAKGWSVEGKTGDGESDIVQLGDADTHDYIDLGLPSGTLWATCNVGASRPQDTGLFFAWGDTQGHGNDVTDGYLFDWNSYKWSQVIDVQSYLTKYCSDGDQGLDGFTDYKYVLDFDDDAAYVNWGSEWRTPSKAQFDELRSQCTWTWTEIQGVEGFEVTGPNGNSIFLPETGWRIDDQLLEDGAYWARTSDPDNQGAYQCAWYFQGEELCWQEIGGRMNGQCVRPVINTPIETTYYLLGAFNDWDVRNMLPFGDNDCTSLTQALSGEFLIKDTDGNWWGGATGDANYTLVSSSPSVTLATDGKKNLNLAFPATYMFSIQDGVLTVRGFPAEGLYVVGDFNDWTPEQMTDNGDGIYTLQKVLSAGDTFKFRNHEGNWYGGDTGGQGDTYGIHSEWCTDIPLTQGDAGSNFVIATEGAYTFTVTQADGNLTLDVTGFGSVTLTDNADNTEAIAYAAQNGSAFDVILEGRTLYKDGSWNTLCLPFEVDLTDADCPLSGDGVEARELEDAAFSGGTLTLTFGDPVQSLSAGVPYIIKWENTGQDITEPVFTSANSWSSLLQPVEFEGVVTFTGTYSPVEVSSLGDNTMLYLGAGNTLHYPEGAMTIGCPRAYFQLSEGITAGEADSEAPIRAFSLNFGDETSAIEAVSNGFEPSNVGSGWFTPDGRRLSGKPSAKGIYIRNGSKVIISH